MHQMPEISGLRRDCDGETVVIVVRELHIGCDAEKPSCVSRLETVGFRSFCCDNNFLYTMK